MSAAVVRAAVRDGDQRDPAAGDRRVRGEGGGAKAWILAFILGPVVGLGIMLGVGCAIGANACPLGDPRGTPASASGEEIFMIECASCHGRNGEGGRGPSLVRTGLTTDEVRRKVQRGSPGLMPRYKGKLSPEQIDRVAAHVVSLRGTDE